MSHLPSDPTAPRDPVLVPRGRPGTVSLAGVLMLGGAAAGFLHGVATIVSSAAIGRDFRLHTAALTTAPADEIDDLAKSVQALFLVLGGVEAVLALGMVALALAVLRGNTTARLSAVALGLISLFCGAGGGLGVVGLGAGSNVIVTLGGAEFNAGEPLRAAVPTWLTSLTGGLGCLQALSYIAVVVLLLLPVSNAYFRRRPHVAARHDSEPGDPEPGDPELGDPESGQTPAAPDDGGPPTGR